MSSVSELSGRMGTATRPKAVAEKKAEWPNMTFLLLIDGDTEYQHVVDIIYEIKQQKIENFSFRMEDSDV